MKQRARCSVCELDLCDKSALRKHYRSRKHIRNMKSCNGVSSMPREKDFDDFNIDPKCLDIIKELTEDQIIK